jgi:hypothetical protein
MFGLVLAPLVWLIAIDRTVSFQMTRTKTTMITTTVLRGDHALVTMLPIKEMRCSFPVLHFSASGSTNDSNDEAETVVSTPSQSTKAATTSTSQLELLQPFLPAADPNYRNTGEVGKNRFIVSREGDPTLEELSSENILKIVQIDSSDLEVNTLVWKCLGYRFENGTWNNSKCFPNWKEKYPDPPDLIGMQRIYEPEIDKVSLRANQALVRSIPLEYKQSLKQFLVPLGWKGYKYAELTPNKTRRAQCANWLLFYRENLFGYTVEELRQRREQKQLQQQKQQEPAPSETVHSRPDENEPEWKPPVREVF